MGSTADPEAQGEVEGPAGNAIEGLPEKERALADQALKAACYAGEGEYGFLGGLVNMRAVESEDGDATLVMDVTPNALNRYGYVHGGMLFTLADYAMGAAARTLVEGDAKPVTLEAKANYIGNVREGRLIARCNTLHSGKRLIMLETRIVDADTDDLIMIVTGTYYVIRDDEG